MTQRARALIFGAAVVAAVVAVAASRTGPKNAVPTADASPRSEEDSGGAPEYADFVGADACAPCHRAEHDRWKASTHGRAGGRPGEVDVIAQFDGAPRRFGDATVTPTRKGDDLSFRVQVDGAPEATTFSVDAVVGAGRMFGGGTQGFFTRWRDGTLRFLPFDFIRTEGLWFCNARRGSREGILPIGVDLSVHDCADWPPRRVLGESSEHDGCQSCHGSQIRISHDLEAKAYRTEMATLAIDCEACHGPGRQHVERMRAPAARAGDDIGMRALATLSKDDGLNVCFACHALKTTLRRGYMTGRPFERHYSVLFSFLGEPELHPDGRTKTFAYQEGHLFSDCYVNGGMTCTSCHDPHTQGYRDHVGRPLPDRFDDGQCTSCHESKRAARSAHTHHAPDSPASRCVSCHMPFLRQPSFGTELRYTRSDHTIGIPRPALDAALGIDGACRACHADLTEAQQSAAIARWWGDVKPLAPAIDAASRVAGVQDMREAARLVLRADERHAAGLLAGMARFGAKFLAGDPPDVDAEIVQRLDALTRHASVDVRALALAFLDMIAARDARARTVVDRARAERGPDAERVRDRVAFVLAFYGEAARERGAILKAVELFERSLVVDPGRAATLTSLGFALAHGGRPREAEQRLRRSLEIDPLQPLALLYLGEVLRELAQPDGAVEAWTRAVAMDPGAGLAHLHLGETALEQGKSDEALRHARLAAEGDPRLARAHFLEADAHIVRSERVLAERALARGLAIEPDSEAANETKARLGRLSK